MEMKKRVTERFERVSCKHAHITIFEVKTYQYPSRFHPPFLESPYPAPSLGHPVGPTF